MSATQFVNLRPSFILHLVMHQVYSSGIGKRRVGFLARDNPSQPVIDFDSESAKHGTSENLIGLQSLTITVVCPKQNALLPFSSTAERGFSGVSMADCPMFQCPQVDQDSTQP